MSVGFGPSWAAPNIALEPTPIAIDPFMAFKIDQRELTNRVSRDVGCALPITKDLPHDKREAQGKALIF
jgi:hypothetical protein